MPESLKDQASILVYLFADLEGLSINDLLQIPEHEQINYIRKIIKKTGKTTPLNPELDLPILNIYREELNALFNYHPEPYQGNVLFFSHSKPRYGFKDDVHLPWIDLVKGKIDIFKIEGDHITMNYSPNVDKLADLVKQTLTNQ